MTIVVTGATGHLGRIVVEELLARGVVPDQIVAVGRAVEKIADLAARGVIVRAADYTDPASLDVAFAGADRLLLVSGSEVGRRLAQHRGAIDAAVRANIGFIAYTSIANADTSTMILAAEHKATEELIVASGIRYALLRNCWYLEGYLGQLPTYLAHGIAGAAGDGLISAALRRDYAVAAASAIFAPPAESRVYELGGEAFTLTQLAAELSAATGTTIAYTNLPEAALRDLLVSAGLPAPLAAVFADVDRGISVGDLHVEGDDLAQLLGRAPTSLADAVREAVAAAA